MFTTSFKNLGKNDAYKAGGKGASIGEMTRAGIPVPEGFVLLSEAFEQFLKETGLQIEIDTLLDQVDHSIIHTVDEASEKIKTLILSKEIPQSIKSEIENSFRELGSKYVAVRSSATAEDGQDHAWAGQLDSFLNTTESDLINNIKSCWASLFTPRAIFYRFEKGLNATKISVAVVVQKMINSEKSGIAFSVHPVTENKNQLIIEAGFGLGEAIVSGQITPDSYVVEKEPRKVMDTFVSKQTKGLFRKQSGGNEWMDLDEQGSKQVLSEAEILDLSEIILKIENHYGFPCDIEWAYESGKFYIVQSRPITTLSSVAMNKPDEWIKERFFNAFLLEESLVLLCRNKFFLQELGVTYQNTITVKGVGDFLLKSEEDRMIDAKNKRLHSKFDFIYKINNLEEKIQKLVLEKNQKSPDDYLKLFEIMSEHLAYYGLAKEEATLIFQNEQSSISDKEYVEKWRNYKERWDSHDKLWERISLETNTPIETIHVMTIDEILSLLKGGKLDLGEINKRVASVWSIVEKDGKVSIHLEDMSPVTSSGSDGKTITGQIGFSSNEIITGIVGKDILVVKKTHPDMIDEIKNSKAVVTDEGGILSHAAITCRELKVPCIIGTKIGTETFKNGDRIEVDAMKGTVRII